MLSECCLQRQHSDKISVFDLFQRPKTLISSQKKAKKTSFARMLSQCCLNVVSRDNIQTTFAFCLKILDMFAPRSQSCLNVVSRDNIQTTFARNFFVENIGYVCNSRPKLSECCLQRQHSNNTQTTQHLQEKTFVDNLGYVCNSQPKLFECCLQRQHSDNI